MDPQLNLQMEDIMSSQTSRVCLVTDLLPQQYSNLITIHAFLPFVNEESTLVCYSLNSSPEGHMAV